MNLNAILELSPFLLGVAIAIVIQRTAKTYRKKQAYFDKNASAHVVKYGLLLKGSTILLTFFKTLILFFLFLYFLVNEASTNLWVVFGLMVLFSLTLDILGFVFIFHRMISFDENGVQARFLSTSFIEWEDLADFKEKSYQYTLIAYDNKKIGIPKMMNGVDSLIGEIKQRRPEFGL